MPENQAPPSSRGEVLLRIARASIARREDAARELAQHDWLAAPGATFVTLKQRGELRGCIGSIEPRRALAEDVSHNAWAAAYRDPRFPPVSEDEIESLEVEVSLLSPRQPIVASSEAEALAQLRPGIDGIYLEFQGHSATFLPQVWESLPERRQFLAELKRKAGLPANFWHPDVRLSRYTVEKFQ